MKNMFVYFYFLILSELQFGDILVVHCSVGRE